MQYAYISNFIKTLYSVECNLFAVKQCENAHFFSFHLSLSVVLDDVMLTFIRNRAEISYSANWAINII